MSSRSSPRADPSSPLAQAAQLSPSPQLDHHSRARSISQGLLNKYGDKLPASVHSSLSRRLSPSPDKGYHEQENIGAGLAHAGLFLGATGSAYAVNHSIQDVKDGARAFLYELERVATEARVESNGGLTRVNTSLVKGTIQLPDDAKSIHEVEVHPLTDPDLDQNPFEPAVEALETPVSPAPSADSSTIDNYFVEDISVPHGIDKLFMRARLDCGMEDNAISEEKAKETGFEIQPYSGSELIVGNGLTFLPVGYIDLQFHFQRLQSARTWKLRFLIFPDPPFDVALGRVFIYRAKLLVRPHEALPVEYKKQTAAQEAEARRRAAEAKAASDARRAAQDNAYAGRRRPGDRDSHSTTSRDRPRR